MAGCRKFFVDVASGVKAERPGLADALKYARRGDTIVVWKFDRFGCSLREQIESVNELKARKVCFRSLQESIDTTTSGGRLVVHVFASLAEVERDLIRERTNADLAAARARRRLGGRRRVLDGKRLELARSLHADPKNAPRDIANTLGVSVSTLYRYSDRRLSRRRRRSDVLSPRQTGRRSAGTGTLSNAAGGGHGPVLRLVLQ